MAFTDRGRIGWKRAQVSTDRTRELFVGILLGALIATVGLRNILPIDALAPAIVTLLFAVGAATAGFALLCLRDQARIGVARRRGEPDFRRHRRLRPDRAGPDGQASHPLEST